MTLTNQIIALEGLGGLGKTTFLDQLRELEYSVVKEIPDHDEIRFPVAPKSLPEIVRPRYFNEYYFQREIAKKQWADTLCGLQIFDRGIYVQMAYVYAQDSLQNTHELAYLLQRMQTVENEGLQLVFPMVYFRSEVDFSLERMRKRNRPEESKLLENAEGCFSKEFLTKYKEAYDIIALELKDSALILEIPEVQDNLLLHFTAWLNRKQRFEVPLVRNFVFAFQYDYHIINELLGNENDLNRKAEYLGKEKALNDLK